MTIDYELLREWVRAEIEYRLVNSEYITHEKYSMDILFEKLKDEFVRSKGDQYDPPLIIKY